jgi:hypothetical protein
MKFPVFTEEVMKWAAEEIEGTDYGVLLTDGKLGPGWYRGWFRRMYF